KAEKSLGHRVALSVKIGGGGGYTGKGKHLQYGLDVETWIKEGLVDILVLVQDSNQIDVDLSSWQRVTAGTSCKIVCGTDNITKGHDLTPQEDAALARGEKLNLESGSQSTVDYCKRAVSWYTAGADGFHFFNGWGGPDTLHVIGSLAKAKAYLAQHGQ
ncbi:MAG: hypothetical protein NT011_08685, partial [Kiritimatiellaeota bacterium]|nr:hypothetical protein [Kiritimatiellota bacterium]